LGSVRSGKKSPGCLAKPGQKRKENDLRKSQSKESPGNKVADGVWHERKPRVKKRGKNELDRTRGNLR